MVRCCRSLHSSPSCYNLHRVRVDVRRFRPPGSSAGATEEPAHGANNAGTGGPAQLSHRSRFRYRQVVCEMLGRCSGWECVDDGCILLVGSRTVVVGTLEVREDNWRISGAGKWASDRGLRWPCRNWATLQRDNHCAVWVCVTGLGSPRQTPITVLAIVFGLIATQH